MPQAQNASVNTDASDNSIYNAVLIKRDESCRHACHLTCSALKAMPALRSKLMIGVFSLFKVGE
ncbi:hypothetical protein BD310DRAFT_343878 [Dichomitus squalens]|uniref:Uncharacterized protein n=1 Tax=Dichomitus squalens TaxID=114155 RepID=A0A4Q9PGC3_9APHY|nr:hypothetical protein BD310DRAFT_343878 [Dichomitus squalens]